MKVIISNYYLLMIFKFNYPFNYYFNFVPGLDFINLDVHLEDKENLISFLDGPVSVFGVLNEVKISFIAFNHTSN